MQGLKELGRLYESGQLKINTEGFSTASKELANHALATVNEFFQDQFKKLERINSDQQEQMKKMLTQINNHGQALMNQADRVSRNVDVSIENVNSTVHEAKELILTRASESMKMLISKGDILLKDMQIGCIEAKKVLGESQQMLSEVMEVFNGEHKKLIEIRRNIESSILQKYEEQKEKIAGYVRDYIVKNIGSILISFIKGIFKRK